MEGRDEEVATRRPELPNTMIGPRPLWWRSPSLGVLDGSRPVMRACCRGRGLSLSSCAELASPRVALVTFGEAKVGFCSWLESRPHVMASVEVCCSGGWDFMLPAGGAVH